MPVQLDNTNTNVVTLKSGTSSTGKLIFPSSNGTAGQALKTDGSSNLSWATVTAQPVSGFTTTDTTGSFIASGGTTNQGVAVVAKGSGGFTLQLPDGATTGGNARGLFSVDLCNNNLRSSASNVASGDYSILAGPSNTASGTNSIVLALGTDTNSSTSGIIAGGFYETLSGTGGIMIGNTATSSGGFSMTGGTGPQALIGNTNSGTSAISPSGKNTFILPQRSAASTSPTFYTGGMRLAGYVSKEFGFVEFGGVTTTGTTTTYLTTDAGTPTTSNEMYVGYAGGFNAVVIARSNTGLSKVWSISFYGSSMAGSNAPASSVSVSYSDTGTSAWSLTLSLGTNNTNYIAILATGDSGITTRWWGFAQPLYA